MGYPTDLTDAQWEAIKELFSVGNYGTSRKYPIRILVNAVFYLIKTGCQWRMLPKDFPPYPTVWSFYRRCKIRGVWEKVLQCLVQKSRAKRGRSPDPTYGLIDSQSTKTTGAAAHRGFDGGKKNKRKKAPHNY